MKHATRAALRREAALVPRFSLSLRCPRALFRRPEPKPPIACRRPSRRASTPPPPARRSSATRPPPPSPSRRPPAASRASPTRSSSSSTAAPPSSTASFSLAAAGGRRHRRAAHRDGARVAAAARRRLPAARRRRQHARRGADVGRPHRRLPRRRLGDGGVRRARRGERRRRVALTLAASAFSAGGDRSATLSLAVDGSDLAPSFAVATLARVPDTAGAAALAAATGTHGRAAMGATLPAHPVWEGEEFRCDALRAVGRHGRRPLGLLGRRLAGEVTWDPPNAFEVVTTDLVSAAQRPAAATQRGPRSRRRRPTRRRRRAPTASTS